MTKRWDEAKVTINGVELTSAQVTTLRVALSSFVADVEHLRKLGETGRLYGERGREVETLLIAGASDDEQRRRLAAVDSVLDAELRRALEAARVPRGTAATATIVELLKLFTDSEREELFGKLGERYCIHCGTAQPARGFCQCTNDE